MIRIHVYEMNVQRSAVDERQTNSVGGSIDALNKYCERCVANFHLHNPFHDLARETKCDFAPINHISRYMNDNKQHTARWRLCVPCAHHSRIVCWHFNKIVDEVTEFFPDAHSLIVAARIINQFWMESYIDQFRCSIFFPWDAHRPMM